MPRLIRITLTDRAETREYSLRVWFSSLPAQRATRIDTAEPTTIDVHQVECTHEAEFDDNRRLDWKAILGSLRYELGRKLLANYEAEIEQAIIEQLIVEDQVEASSCDLRDDR